MITALEVLAIKNLPAEWDGLDIHFAKVENPQIGACVIAMSANRKPILFIDGEWKEIKAETAPNLCPTQNKIF